MNKINSKIITALCILIFGILLCNTAFAVGSFSVNKNTATITEGKTTTFKIDGSSATGKINISSSDTTVATVSSASVWIENSTSTITITAKKAGTAVITVSGKVADSKGIEATITKTINVTVNAKQTSNSNTNTNTSNNNTTNNNSGTTTKTKSTNAYLSTLGVRLSDSDAKALGVNANAYDFSGFKKSTLTYNVTVPYEVDSLKVSYKAADSSASVKVSGNSGFEVGSNNKITVKVTAEDGKTTKTYTIKVTKLAEEEEKPGNIIDTEDKALYLTALSIKGFDISPEFSKDVYAYTATIEKPNVTEVEVSAKANKENTSIEISGNTNLIVGENVINVVLKENETTKQVVYQIALTKADVVVTTTSGEKTDLVSGLISNLKNYIIIAVIAVVAIIVIIITLIILLRIENKKLKDEETKEEYGVYENDESEFTDNEAVNETETKNKGKKTKKKEKGRHSN